MWVVYCKGLGRKTYDETLKIQFVKYLCYVVSTETIYTDPGKVEAILRWPTPTFRQEIQWFLS